MLFAFMEPARPPADAVAPTLAWRTLALPNEHGGWGLLCEPALLGLWLAPSWAGVALALAALLAFLARHPLRLALSDRLRGRRYPRTSLAARIAAGYLACAALALGFALTQAPLAAFMPLALATPLGAVQLVYDARLRSRELLPELCGGVALGASVAAITMAGSAPLAPALALWAVLALRVLGSVPYVRARLRASRGLPGARTPVVVAHAAGLCCVGLLSALALVPWLGVLAMAILLARALLGLRTSAAPLAPRVVGLQELGYGALTVVLLAAGAYLGW